MRIIIDIVAGVLVALSLLLGHAHAQSPVTPGLQQTNGSGGPVWHVHTTALADHLVVKDNPGTVGGFNCTAVAGGAAGYCVAYDATTTPATGALTGSLVLDVCYFDTTARGCALAHIPNGILTSKGIVILMTSASTPFTYTTGTDTGFISADYN
jgi:hypothetical protein